MSNQAAKPVPFPQIKEETLQRLSDHAAQLAANTDTKPAPQPLSRWFKRAA